MSCRAWRCSRRASASILALATPSPGAWPTARCTGWLQAAGLSLEPWVDLASAGVPWSGGLNLNGIVVTADTRHLVACQTNLGRFWRVRIADGTVAEVDLDGGPLEHCDGLAISGPALYVAVNARNLVAVVELSADGASGRVARQRSCDAFAFPTAVAVRGGEIPGLERLRRRGGAALAPHYAGRPPRPSRTPGHGRLSPLSHPATSSSAN